MGQLSRGTIYKVSNNGSTVKALEIMTIEFFKSIPGIGYLIHTYGDDGNLISTLRGPLRRLGKSECKILGHYNPSHS